MNYIFTVAVLRVNRPNRAGRLYPREIIETAIKEAGKTILLVVTATDDWGGPMISLDKAVGEVNRMWVGDDDIFRAQGRLFGNVKPLEGLPSEQVVRLVGNFKLVPVGSGAVGPEDQVLDGYRLNGFLLAEDSNDEAAENIPVVVVPDGVGT
jgi:hypothetical protein